MSVYPIKVKGKNKLKLLKSWYGYHRWDRELKCVITKRQAAQHANLQQIYMVNEKDTNHTDIRYSPKQACEDSLLTRIKEVKKNIWSFFG